MIDIHCHILPAVDDGSNDRSTSMMMAAMAADDGVEQIVATPHFFWRERKEQREFSSAYRWFTDALKENGLPVTCHLGAEVLLSGEADPTDLSKFPCLAGTSYALVEFFFEEKEEQMTAWLALLLSSGIRVIVAHPERYDAVKKKKKILYHWKELGCLLQVNKGSLNGQLGKKEQSVAKWMMKNRLPDFLATDAHGVKYRTTRVFQTLEALSKEYGREYIELLTEKNPRLLLENKEI